MLFGRNVKDHSATLWSPLASSCALSQHLRVLCNSNGTLCFLWVFLRTAWRSSFPICPNAFSCSQFYLLQPWHFFALESTQGVSRKLRCLRKLESQIAQMNLQPCLEGISFHCDAIGHAHGKNLQNGSEAQRSPWRSSKMNVNLRPVEGLGSSDSSQKMLARLGTFPGQEGTLCVCRSMSAISLKPLRPWLLGWRPLLLGWRPLLLVRRPLLLGWRPLLLGHCLWCRVEA